MVKKVSIPLSALFTNVGQIDGLPPNPRLIKDEKFEALKKSLTDDPEMLDLRELIVYPNPSGKIIGLSKIARVVDYHSARLQIQERLVSDIVGDIRFALGESNPPLGIALVMEGEHLCKSMRGVKKSGKMTTSYLTGIFKDGPARSEFLEIAGRLLK